MASKNERPTENDWNSFRSINTEKKIIAMCRYLLVSGAKMEDIGWELFGNEGSFTVSMIHRCYNFSGVNGGRYSPTSKFCREYGEVLPEDIDAFVRQNPNGIRTTVSPGSHIECDEFLKKRIAQRQLYAQNNNFNNNMNYYNSQNNQHKSNNTLNADSMPTCAIRISTTDNDQHSYKNTGSSYNLGSSNNTTNPDDVGIIIGAIGCCILGFTVLFIVLALIFNWFHWRSKLLGFISDWIWVAWFVGMLIFLIRIIAGRVEYMNYKKFSTKVILFLVIGAATFLISSCIGGLFYYLSLK